MRKKKINKLVLSIGIVSIVFGAGLLFSSGNKTSNTVGTSNGNILASNTEKPHMTVYKSSTCGCCGNYISYLKREGYDVEVIEIDDVSPTKEKYGVPMDQASCHTTVVGDEEYVVEGHVPVEAIEQLLAVRPGVKGIGLAGMPVGSPGMPGAKRSTFNVYSFDGNGGAVSFMSL